MTDPFIIIINVGAVPQGEEAMDTSEGEGTTSDTSTLTWLLSELLDNYVNKTQPSVRQVRQWELRGMCLHSVFLNIEEECFQ